MHLPYTDQKILLMYKNSMLKPKQSTSLQLATAAKHWMHYYNTTVLLLLQFNYLSTSQLWRHFKLLFISYDLF